MSAEIPDTISTAFVRVSVGPGGRTEVTADTVETYEESNRTVLENVEILEYNPEAVLTTRGQADRLEMRGEKFGEARGDIVVEDISGESELQAQALSWDGSDRMLRGTGEVSVKSGDGLTVSGEGFQADMARELYSFENGAQGTLEIEDE